MQNSICIHTIIPRFWRNQMRVMERRCRGNGSSEGGRRGARMTFLRGGGRNLKLRHWLGGPRLVGYGLRLVQVDENRPMDNSDSAQPRAVYKPDLHTYKCIKFHEIIDEAAGAWVAQRPMTVGTCRRLVGLLRRQRTKQHCPTSSVSRPTCDPIYACARHHLLAALNSIMQITAGWLRFK